MKRLLVCGKSLFLLLLLFTTSYAGSTSMTSLVSIRVMIAYERYWDIARVVIGSVMFVVSGYFLLMYFFAQCTGQRFLTYGQISESTRRAAPGFLRMYSIFFVCVMALYVTTGMLSSSLSGIMQSSYAYSFVGLVRGIVVTAMVFLLLLAGCALYLGAYGLGDAFVGTGAFLQRNTKWMLIAAPCAWLAAVVMKNSQQWWSILALKMRGVDFDGGRYIPIALEPSVESALVTCGVAVALMVLAERKVQVTVDTDSAAEFWKLIGLTFITCGIYHYVWVYKMSNRIKRQNPIGKGMEPGLSVVLSVLFDEMFYPFWVYSEDGGLAEIAARRGMRYDINRGASFFWMLAVPFVGGLIPFLLCIPTIIDGIGAERQIFAMYAHILLACCGAYVSLYGLIKRARMVLEDDNIGG